jgi:hypothetical protein
MFQISCALGECSWRDLTHIYNKIFHSSYRAARSTWRSVPSIQSLERPGECRFSHRRTSKSHQRSDLVDLASSASARSTRHDLFGRGGDRTADRPSLYKSPCFRQCLGVFRWISGTTYTSRISSDSEVATTMNPHGRKP